MAIVWESGKYSTSKGYVGNLEMFSVGLESIRRKDGRNWYLATQLPMQVPTGMEHWEKQDDAQRAADALLGMFLGHVERHWEQPETA